MTARTIEELGGKDKAILALPRQQARRASTHGLRLKLDSV